MNKYEYNKELEELAEDIVKEGLKYGSEVSGVAHETIDSHRWVIYTAFHSEIYQVSDNQVTFTIGDAQEGMAATFQMVSADIQPIINKFVVQADREIEEFGDLVTEVSDALDTGDGTYKELCDKINESIDLIEEADFDIQNLIEEGSVYTYAEIKEAAYWMFSKETLGVPGEIGKFFRDIPYEHSGDSQSEAFESLVRLKLKV